MQLRECPKCFAQRPIWCTYKLCPKCHKAEKRWAKKIEAVLPVVGVESAARKVIVVESSQVITFRTRHDKIWRTALAHTRHCQMKKTGELTKYWNLIWINPRRSSTWTPEKISQTLSSESIHLALFSLGLGRENVQLDKFGLHSWNDLETQIAEYEGLSVQKLGLKSED